MEAFSEMMKSIPPVGHPVVLNKLQVPADDLMPGYKLTWLNSGTEALAYSLAVIKQVRGEVTQPEVIIPGYCCPDLLSAAIYAGFKPVVVDICENDPSYDLLRLEAALTENTCAVIAINFMGLKERLSDIRSIIADRKIYLIEDNAQWFPEANEIGELEGDFVTFSFGRGKAINLLGGGLVAVKSSVPDHSLEIALSPNSGVYIAKVLLFQMLSKPSCYYWLEKIPALKVGSTEFHSLEGLNALPEQKRLRFMANYQAYCQRSTVAEQSYDQLLDDVNQLRSALTSVRRMRLLRYPLLLASTELRSQMLQQLSAAGLGISGMYNSEISKVAGVGRLALSMPDLPNARSFAHRLLTLPTHSAVTPVQVTAISNQLNKLC